MATTAKREWMDLRFALFNLHCNRAGERADVAFVKKYGRKEWGRRIRPYHRSGIMGIFNDPPNEWTKFYVEQVQAFVNEGVEKPDPV